MSSSLGPPPLLAGDGRWRADLDPVQGLQGLRRDRHGLETEDRDPSHSR